MLILGVYFSLCAWLWVNCTLSLWIFIAYAQLADMTNCSLTTLCVAVVTSHYVRRGGLRLMRFPGTCFVSLYHFPLLHVILELGISALFMALFVNFWPYIFQLQTYVNFYSNHLNTRRYRMTRLSCSVTVLKLIFVRTVTLLSFFSRLFPHSACFQSATQSSIWLRYQVLA